MMLDRAEPWPPNYAEHYRWRQNQLFAFARSRSWLEGARAFYAQNPTEFINDWCDTSDPRHAGKDDRLVNAPFLLFRRQRQYINFLHQCMLTQTNGLVEKSRDMGATWGAVGFSVWAWLFLPGSSIGWGSRKADLVDRIGDLDSIFEKIRFTISRLPHEFRPVGWDGAIHSMKVYNPDNGASITGESGDNIGRGGRKRIYFKDESAHYERPELIEAALADNTNVQIDISSVNGVGNVFHRKREAGIEWEPGMLMRRGRTQVFIMDWRDHPEKTQEWYEARRIEATASGLLHVFAQEVDRNYAASVQGALIPMEWVRSAIDAHLKLNLPVMAEGPTFGGLDVADEGGDRNAIAIREGVVLGQLEEWGERDTTLTARRAIGIARDFQPIALQYDSIGVGSGVKGESNRLLDEDDMPKGIRMVPWNAGLSGASLVDADGFVNENDENSPRNRDFFDNLKAQGWWSLRRRFEKTNLAMNRTGRFRPDELISISGTLPHLRALEKELTQITVGYSGRMKLKINKAPNGTRSPNLADAVMMAYFPIPQAVKTYDDTMSWVG